MHHKATSLWYICRLPINKWISIRHQDGRMSFYPSAQKPIGSTNLFSKQGTFDTRAANTKCITRKQQRQSNQFIPHVIVFLETTTVLSAPMVIYLK